MATKKTSTTKTASKQLTSKGASKAVGKAVAKKVAKPGVRVPVTTGREPWQDDLRRYVRKWRAEHPQKPNPEGIRMARTFLKISRTSETAARAAGLGPKEVPVLVQNLGNVAAYTCVVKALEARARSPIHEKIPLPEFKLGGQVIFTLQPGEQREIRVPYVRTIANGTFVALISDPILDPNDLAVADMNHRRILLFNLV